jgi:hypothetical protein
MTLFQKLKLLGAARMCEFEEYGTKNHQKFYNNIYYMKKRNLLKFDYDEKGEIILRINHNFIDEMVKYIE